MSRYVRGWSAEHQKVYLMYSEGKDIQQIDEKLQIGKERIRTIIRSKQFQTYHKRSEKCAVETARKVFESRLIEAAGKIIRLMQKGKMHEKLQFDAAKEILYQCGMKPADVIETRTRQYTPEEAASALKVVKEIQSIEENLATQGSGFLIKREMVISEDSAPVETGTAESTLDAAPVETGIATPVPIEEIQVVR